MAEISTNPAGRVEASSTGEDGSGKEQRMRKTMKPGPVTRPALQPDVDLDGKEEKHQLDERA